MTHHSHATTSRFRRLARPKVVTLMILALLIFAAGGFFAERTRAARKPVRRVRIESVRSLNGITGRSLLKCSAGDCILLHYPRHLTDSEPVSETLLKGNPEDPTDDGEILRPASGRWSNPEAYSTYNCCTFAVGDHVGLRTTDWVAPELEDETDGTIPMRVLLASFYRHMQTIPAPTQRWEPISWKEPLQDGDVVCFVRRRSEDVSMLHVGRIQYDGERPWLLSKLGRGPIVRASVEATLRHYFGSSYGGLYVEIEVFRPKRMR